MFKGITRSRIVSSLSQVSGAGNTLLSINNKRFNSSFDQLSKLIKQSSIKTSISKNDNNQHNDNGFEKSDTIDHVNELLGGLSSDASTPSYFSNRSRDYNFGNALKHPRDVAKGIRLQGPAAGRTVDVQYGNFGFAVGGIRRITRSNKLQYLQKVQSRFIRPAKYQKQKKREWWRRRFSEGFRDLMRQVQDSKRRGY